MQKIIVPVDFSATATNAAEFAGNLAIFYGAEIWLYHSYEIPVGISEYPFPVFDVKVMQEAADHELDLFKEKLQKSLRSAITIHTKSEMNVFVPGLQELCDYIKPDLVVMGLSGKDALTKLIVGSNTIKIIHQLQYPVLVIPPKASFSPVRKIGFACDYEQVAATTPVSLLLKFVQDFNAALYIMNVDFDNQNFTPDTVEESLVIKDLFKNANPVYESIEAADVTDGINHFAATAGLDWIAVIPKKHTLVQKIFSRSHSKELLYHTFIPVLCVHQ